MLGLSAAVVLGMLALFVVLMGGPDYNPLFTELEPEDAQVIAQRLAARQIAHRISDDSRSVLVPADQVGTLRMEMAAQGLPHKSRLGLELFDKPNWGGSDFAEKVNYQRALEGELERTIQSLDAVENVRVHLVMPQGSLFSARDRGAKASVLVKLRGPRLAEEATEAITQLVSGAVDNLKPEEVAVINADSRVLLNPRKASGPGGSGKALEAEQALAEKLLATLSPIVGRDGVQATVTMEYDWSSREQTQETYDPTQAVPLAAQQSEEQRGGVAPGGIPGTASNVPAARAVEMAAQSTQRATQSQVLRSENTTYAVSKMIRHVVEPAGQVRRISTAVLVDDVREMVEENGAQVEKRRGRTPEEMTKIQELVKGAVGFDAERGDLLTVENISFELPPVPELAPPTALERGFRILDQWRPLVRYVALFLLFVAMYWLVLRPIKRQVLVTLAPQPALAAEPGTRQLEGPEVVLPAPSLAAEGVAIDSLVADAEGKQSVMLKKTLADKVKRDPEGASRLIQNWIRQDEEKA